MQIKSDANFIVFYIILKKWMNPLAFIQHLFVVIENVPFHSDL